MHEFVSFNGRIVPASDPVPANLISAAAFYGKGVFTTIAVRDSEPFLLEKHWSRLLSNAAKLSIDLGDIPVQSLAASLAKLMEKNGFQNGRARVTFLDKSHAGPWRVRGETGTNIVIVTGDRRRPSENFCLTESPYKVNTTTPLAGVKSCNYLEPLMSLDEAVGRGFDEAVRPNERGEIASACMANVFWLKGGRLFTPSLATGCLAGTTREHILENIECEEAEAEIEELRRADEIFLTSAGIDVVQVAEFDGRKLQHGNHRITEILPI